MYVKTNINATEKWFLRRMQTIAYTDRETNEAVLNKATTTLFIMKTHHEPQVTFVRHVMKRNELEHRTIRTFEGKRSTGRLIEKMVDSVSTWLEKNQIKRSIASWIATVGDMIAQAGRYRTG